ncbi:MAG: EAL domain-containing protein [Acidimicrobiia bacterium]|nr:EAL domain-containing protein [Acidimicrobiia bacterium]
MAVLGQLFAAEELGTRKGAAENLSVVAGRIRQSERRFRSMIENANDFFAIVDLAGTPLYISPSVRPIVGADPIELVGSCTSGLHHPEDLPRVVEAFFEAVRDGRSEVDFRFRHRDGSWRWLELTITNRLEDPDITGLVLAGRDVTERKEAEEALRLSEERWRALLMNSSDLITVLDVEGRVSYASPSIERLLGFTSQQVLEMSVFELVHAEDLERAGDTLLKLIDSEGPSDPIEMRVRHADGGYRSIEAVAKNMLDDPNIAGIVVNVRDVTERRRAEELLALQATTDSLTGLPNRALLLDRLGAALNRSERTGKLTALLFLDIDHFKLVNDSLGHAVGDLLLVEVANRLQGFVADGGSAARLGGDEFALCCENVDSYDAAADIADRLADVLAEPIVLGDQDLSVTASIGITCACDATRTPEDLLRDADVAMYRAKERGRARSEVFIPSMRVQARARLEQQLDVRRALMAGQFRMNYQPVIRLDTQQLAGAEALVRWAHPRRGLVLPGEFIPAAEETGVIESLGTWVIAETIAEAAAWASATPTRMGVSINISPRQLASGRLPALITTALDIHGLKPRDLCLEITESLLVEDPDEAEKMLKELADLGVRIAIDDFGTGYSSLAYLKRFPIDILKIDQSFLSGIESDTDNRAIVETILGLASNLDLRVIAEGVEGPEQLKAVRDLGCHYAQGFYIGRPIPPEAFDDLIKGSGTR